VSCVADPRPHRLLMVDDDRELGTMLAGVFAEEGYAVDLAADGHRGLHLALSRPYDAMILDRGLPAIDGIELLVRLRRRASPRRSWCSRLRHGRRPGRRARRGRGGLPGQALRDRRAAGQDRALVRRNLDQARLLPLGAGWLDAESHLVRLPTGDQVRSPARSAVCCTPWPHAPAGAHRAALRERISGRAGTETIVDTYVYYLRAKLGQAVVETVRASDTAW